MKLKANKSFWRGAPKFDELVFKTYKDQDAAVAALRKGEVSFVAGAPALTPAQAASLKGDKNIKVNEGPGRRFFALATNPGAQTKDGKKFGNGNKALLDQKVRQALFLSIDRKTIIDKVFQGHAVEGQGYIPPRFSRLLLAAVRQPEAGVRPRPRRPSSSTRRGTSSRATSASARTASRSTCASCATPRTRTTRRSASTSRSGGASSASG